MAACAFASVSGQTMAGLEAVLRHKESAVESIKVSLEAGAMGEP
jgi:hypothetical protein